MIIRKMNKQCGEIATALTIVALGMMTIGALLGSWVVQQQSFNLFPQATEATCTDTDGGKVYNVAGISASQLIV